MVSGDGVECCKAIAVQARIMLNPDAAGGIITGEQFRERYGSVIEVVSSRGKEHKLEKQEDFNRAHKYLRVIARATPEDKYALLVGLKALNKKVAVTGEGISDVEALREADVSFAMGCGCDLAKENADMIILKNNFASVVKAARYSRNIFNNVRKFL